MLLGRKHRTYPDEEKDSTENKLKTLRQVIKEKDKEIQRLKSELKTLNKAFEKSAKYMSEESKELTTEQLIKAANNHQTLAETKKELSEKDKENATREATRLKWAEWRKKLPIKEENES